MAQRRPQTLGGTTEAATSIYIFDTIVIAQFRPCIRKALFYIEFLDGFGHILQCVGQRHCPAQCSVVVHITGE